MFQNDAKRQETCVECDFEVFRGVCGVCGRGGGWLVAIGLGAGGRGRGGGDLGSNISKTMKK